MDRIIIGLTGSLSSGKGVVSEHLKELGFHHFMLSDIIRDEIRKRGQEINRVSLQDVGNKLRQEFGGAVLAIKTAELIDNAHGNVVIDGVRNPSEIKYLRQVYDVRIIGIDAPKEIRCEWYLQRAKERGEDGKTAEDFERDNDRDFGIGEPENGQHVGKCLELADEIIINRGTKLGLRDEVDQYLRDIYYFDPETHSSHPERNR